MCKLFHLFPKEYQVALFLCLQDSDTIIIETKKISWQVVDMDLNKVSFKRLVFLVSELSLKYLEFFSSLMVMGRKLCFLEKRTQCVNTRYSFLHKNHLTWERFNNLHQWQTTHCRSQMQHFRKFSVITSVLDGVLNASFIANACPLTSLSKQQKPKGLNLSPAIFYLNFSAFSFTQISFSSLRLEAEWCPLLPWYLFLPLPFHVLKELIFCWNIFKSFITLHLLLQWNLLSSCWYM